MSHEDAIDEARSLTKSTHFDYSANNRPRYMRVNVMRVIIQFKQYSQNVAYIFSRAAYESVKGESPAKDQGSKKTPYWVASDSFHGDGNGGIAFDVGGAYGDECHGFYFLGQ